MLFTARGQIGIIMHFCCVYVRHYVTEYLKELLQVPKSGDRIVVLLYCDTQLPTVTTGEFSSVSAVISV